YDAFDNFAPLSPLYSEDWTKKTDEELKNLIEEIDKDKSHLTFRIKQVLAFLELRHISAKNYSIDEFAKSIDGIYNLRKWRYINLIPPQCFETVIQLKEKKRNKKAYSFSKLSTGEKQLVYSSSSFL